jgi:hypothetical protein
MARPLCNALCVNPTNLIPYIESGVAYTPHPVSCPVSHPVSLPVSHPCARSSVAYPVSFPFLSHARHVPSVAFSVPPLCRFLCHVHCVTSDELCGFAPWACPRRSRVGSSPSESARQQGGRIDHVKAFSVCKHSAASHQLVRVSLEVLASRLVQVNETRWGRSGRRFGCSVHDAWAWEDPDGEVTVLFAAGGPRMAGARREGDSGTCRCCMCCMRIPAVCAGA